MSFRPQPESTPIWQFSDMLSDTLGVPDGGHLPFCANQVRDMGIDKRIAKFTIWPFLIDMERMGVGPSAEALQLELSAAGRNIQRVRVASARVAAVPVRMHWHGAGWSAKGAWTCEVLDAWRENAP